MRGQREKELPGAVLTGWEDGKRIVGAVRGVNLDGIRNGENLCGRLSISYGMNSVRSLGKKGKRYFRMFGKREMGISKSSLIVLPKESKASLSNMVPETSMKKQGSKALNSWRCRGMPYRCIRVAAGSLLTWQGWRLF